MNKSNIALIIGGTGAIGNALAEELKQNGFLNIVQLSRSSHPNIELTNENTIRDASLFIKNKATPLCLIFDATGILHSAETNQMPEKTYKNFEINTFGPALLMKYFLPLLDSETKSIFASLSAKVGSIEDNKYGGWYSYRASKAALNQFIKTASIELAMKNKKAICVAVHPGTVTSNLSKPFQKTDLKIQSPQESAKNILKVILNLNVQNTGSFYNWDGSTIPW
jgi:NAD(P)-dependent dehydrogenase (short-subunit alcohol dehydrogenase family)